MYHTVSESEEGGGLLLEEESRRVGRLTGEVRRRHQLHVVHRSRFHAAPRVRIFGLRLLALGRHFPISRLNAVLLHRQRSLHLVQLIVETTGIADRLATAVSPPQRRRVRVAVHAYDSSPFLGALSLLRLYQRPVLAIHLVVEPAGVTEVVTGAVSSPEWSRLHAAVHAFSTFGC